MGLKVGEFFVDMIVDAASGNLSVRQLIGAMGELEVKSLGGAWGISKVAEKIVGLAQSAMAAATNLVNFRTLTGADPKMVQSWDTAAAQLGVTTGSIQASIRRVQDVLAPIRIGAAGEPQLLRALGIPSFKGIDSNNRRIMKSYKDLMLDISRSRRFWAMPLDTRLMMLPSVGLSDQDYLILNDMRTGAFQKKIQAPILDEKQLAYFREIDRIGASIQNLGQSMFYKLLFDGKALLGYMKEIEIIFKHIRESMDTELGQKIIKGAQNAPRAAGDWIWEGAYDPKKFGQMFFNLLESIRREQPQVMTRAEVLSKNGIVLNLSIKNAEGKETFRYTGPLREELNGTTINADAGGSR